MMEFTLLTDILNATVKQSHRSMRGFLCCLMDQISHCVIQDKYKCCKHSGQGPCRGDMYIKRAAHLLLRVLTQCHGLQGSFCHQWEQELKHQMSVFFLSVNYKHKPETTKYFCSPSTFWLINFPFSSTLSQSFCFFTFKIFELCNSYTEKSLHLWSNRLYNIHWRKQKS